MLVRWRAGDQRVRPEMPVHPKVCVLRAQLEIPHHLGHAQVRGVHRQQQVPQHAVVRIGNGARLQVCQQRGRLRMPSARSDQPGLQGGDAVAFVVAGVADDGQQRCQEGRQLVAIAQTVEHAIQVGLVRCAAVCVGQDCQQVKQQCLHRQHAERLLWNVPPFDAGVTETGVCVCRAAQGGQQSTAILSTHRLGIAVKHATQRITGNQCRPGFGR